MVGESWPASAQAYHGAGPVTRILKTANEKSVYEELVVGELDKPLDFETGRFDAATCIGTLTIGHAPPGVAGRAGAGHKAWRDDRLLDADGLSYQGRVRRKQAALEEAGRWRLLERGAPFQPMPHGEPDIWYEIWRTRCCPRPSPPRPGKTMLQLVRAARPFRTEWTSLLPYQGQRLVGAYPGRPSGPLYQDLPPKSSQFGTCRPTKLDKIKNFRVALQAGSVVAEPDFTASEQ